MLSQGQIEEVLPFEVGPMKWLKIKVNGQIIEQITIADVAVGDVILVDTDTAAIFTSSGEEITYIPRPITVHGTVTQSLDGKRLIVNIDSEGDDDSPSE
jgi:hypothetical protein